MTKDINTNNRVQRRTVLRKGAVAASGVALGTGVLSGSAAAKTVITEPTVIDEPGHYTLEDDVSGGAPGSNYRYDAAIQINVSNVTLEGNGHSVSGYWAIFASQDAITIQNLTAEAGDGFAIGVGNRSTVRNVDAQGAYGPGVALRKSSRVINSTISSVWAAVECGSNSTVENNTINNQLSVGDCRGVLLQDADNVTVTNNTVTPPRDGFWDPAIDLRNADDNRIANNSVRGDTQVGVRIDSDSANNNVIRNDLRSAETPIEDDGTNTRLVANRTE